MGKQVASSEIDLEAIPPQGQYAVFEIHGPFDYRVERDEAGTISCKLYQGKQVEMVIEPSGLPSDALRAAYDKMGGFVQTDFVE